MKRIVFWDMDGLVADFVSGALAFHGKSLPMAEVTWDFPLQLGFKETWCPTFWQPLGTKEFWRDLLPLDDGMELFHRVEAAVGKDRLCILSSGQSPGSPDGKREWLEKWLPGYAKTAIFAHAKHLVAAPDKVLVDDYDGNVDKFVAAGGRACLVPRPWNTKRHLSCPQGRFQVGQVLDELIPLIEAA